MSNQEIKPISKRKYGKIIEQAQKIADEAIQRHLDGEVRALGMLNDTLEKLASTNSSLELAVKALEEIQYQIQQSNHPANIGMIAVVQSTLDEIRRDMDETNDTRKTRSSGQNDATEQIQE